MRAVLQSRSRDTAWSTVSYPSICLDHSHSRLPFRRIAEVPCPHAGQPAFERDQPSQLPDNVRRIMPDPQRRGDQGDPDHVAASAARPHRRQAGDRHPGRSHMTAAKPQTRSVQRTTRLPLDPHSKTEGQDPQQCVDQGEYGTAVIGEHGVAGGNIAPSLDPVGPVFDHVAASAEQPHRRAGPPGY
ncbi:hypothetical protein [Actinomadura sp. NBRC 104425]|uniref:hypothetical protein n=1 Tax=Actinomadura sp. NBRC 104425 TaxID=3032204 RepID=UPI0025560E6F|nr:hypothetical protein [Actinomadura sp. NBRC 104425]